MFLYSAVIFIDLMFLCSAVIFIDPNSARALCHCYHSLFYMFIQCIHIEHCRGSSCPNPSWGEWVVSRAPQRLRKQNEHKGEKPGVGGGFPVLWTECLPLRIFIFQSHFIWGADIVNRQKYLLNAN